VGDTADYTYSSPHGTGGIRLHILQINGTSVTADIRALYPNGTEGPDNTFTGNLSEFTNELFPYLVPADLNQGDSVIPSFTMFNITETITTSVTGINRTVNHVEYALTIPGNNGYYFNGYWDKATGLLVMENATIRGNIWGLQPGSTILNLTSTTAFATQNAEQTAIAILILAAGTIAAVAILVMADISQKKHKTRR
jgi:hypothetical protein